MADTKAEDAKSRAEQSRGAEVKSRAEQDKADFKSTKRTGTTTSDDSFGNTDLTVTPGFLTAEDAAGVERIVAPKTDSWTPAPTDPDPEMVERAEKRIKREEEEREARLKALGYDGSGDDNAEKVVGTPRGNTGATAESQGQGGAARG